ncbi:MAG TPA: SUMF1/EgtB/PvdO family nonheme iron enzyme [Armatimonadota bacterium]|nr:SUMF1/EgtB/PvdO family nonheme iron enzyme [Armatimonadota bacterium]
MPTNGLVYAPDTPNWAQIRNIEYSYQVSLIADNPTYLRQFMVATQAMQTQSLLTANAQLAEVNRGILGIQQGIGELTGAVQQGFSDLSYAMQEGFDQLGGMMQEGFSLVAAEMQRQNAIMVDIAKLLSTKLEGEAREIRNSALSAVREGCSPEAFDQEGSLREALQLFRITVEHPIGMRDYVAWFNIGWLHWKLDGNLDEAEKAFATAVRQSMEKKDAYHVMAARHLAYMRFLLGKTDGAYQGIRLALQTAGDDPENLFTQMLIAAQANNAAELLTAFRALITDHPEWLAACLAEPELNPFQAQLQPVVDTLVGDARAQVRAAVDQVNAKLRDAGDMAKAVRRATLLSTATQQKITAIKELINGVNLDTADWPTMHRLVKALLALCTDVARDVDGVRPIYDLITSMIIIPAGEFLYGEKKERKQLSAFTITKHPITVAQYRQFCEATGRAMPSAPHWGWQDTHPIVNVTWHDAAAFAAWAGLALPTEEEWEKAARGTDGREYPWGNLWDASKCCHSVGQSAGKTAPVGSYPVGASPYGVLDMAGNVWEWCDSWYKANETRVLRGGSWYGGSPDLFRAASRLDDNPADSDYRFGFRCVSRSPGQ